MSGSTLEDAFAGLHLEDQSGYSSDDISEFHQNTGGASKVSRRFGIFFALAETTIKVQDIFQAYQSQHRRGRFVIQPYKPSDHDASGEYNGSKNLATSRAE